MVRQGSLHGYHEGECVCVKQRINWNILTIIFFHCCSWCVISKSVFLRISSRWQDYYTYLMFIPSLPLSFYYLRVAVICTASVVLSVLPMALGSPLVRSSAVLQWESAQSLTKFSCLSLSWALDFFLFLLKLKGGSFKHEQSDNHKWISRQVTNH